jgi:mycothiol synthase
VPRCPAQRTTRKDGWMDLEIKPFDPVRAPGLDLMQHHRIATAVHGLDFPDRPASSYEHYLSVLRAPISAWGPRRLWVARLEGRIVATAMVDYPDTENRRSAITSVRVPPDLRRRGIGTAVLGATLPDCRAADRDTVVGYGVKTGGDGEKWVQGLGFAKVAELVWQTLKIPVTDPTRWQIAPPDGFRAERWTGAAPQLRV